MYTEPHADYAVTIRINDEEQYGYADWYAGYEEAYTIDVRRSGWFDGKDFALYDSNGSGPEGFTTWEAAKTAFIEAVAQQMMLDSTREMGVTQ